MKPHNLKEVMQWVRSHAKGASCVRKPESLAPALAASKTPKAIRKWRKKFKATMASKRNGVRISTERKAVDSAATVA